MKMGFEREPPNAQMWQSNFSCGSHRKMKLKDKIAIVTGAGSGMGKAAALLFAREGARIGAIDVDEKSAAETAREITSAGGKSVGIRADVSKHDDVQRAIAQAVENVGPPTVL